MITANLRRPVGRPRGPTKLTPELMARTFELVQRGMNLDGVAYSVGINPTTFYRWMREGRVATEGPYYEFFAVVKKGLAHFECSGALRVLLSRANGVGQELETVGLAAGAEVPRTLGSPSTTHGSETEEATPHDGRAQGRDATEAGDCHGRTRGGGRR
jgi:hypothetical protein